MIQRIQTVYLVLAALALGLLFLPVFPLATLDESSLATGAPSFLADGRLSATDHPGIWALVILGMGSWLASIFLYKNRKVQLRLSRTGMFLCLWILFFSGFLLLRKGESQDMPVESGLGLILPVAAAIFGLLAVRSIRKDEELVKSMDRLR